MPVLRSHGARRRCSKPEADRRGGYYGHQPGVRPGGGD